MPLWIINENNKKSLLGESVYTYLQQALLSRKKSYESENWGQDVPESVTYTVVTSPPHRHPTVMVPAFTLTSLDRSASVVSIDEEVMHKKYPKIRRSFVNFIYRSHL